MIERRLVSRPISTIGTLISANRTQQPANDIVRQGLALHLDAANPYSYPASGTTWTDLVGNSNGTLTNGPTFSTENYGAILFDGTNDFVTVPHVAAFVATNEYTLECVFYWDGVNATDGLFGKRAGTPVQQLQLYINSENLTGPGDRIMSLFDAGGGVSGYISWQMPSAGIYHAQATRSSSAHRLTVNGVFRVENTTAVTATYNTNSPFIVANANGLTTYFPNKVYLCRYYTRALSDSELYQNFKATQYRFQI